MKKVSKILAIALVILTMAGLAVFTTACGGGGGAEGGGSETANAKVRVIDIDLTQEDYAFGVDKDQEDLLKKANEIIADLKESGEFDEICNHYFGDGEPVAVTSGTLDTSKDQLVVATNAAFEPFEFMKGDKYYGIDMEIAQIIADKMGKELVINNMDFDAVCLSVGQHKCDIAMAGLTVNKERTKYVTFSTPYYEASQKLIVAADDTTFDECKTAEDVNKILSGFDKSTKIGYQNGTTGQFFVQGNKEWDFPGLKVDGKGYKNGSLAVQDLVNGNIKYVIIDKAPADAITAKINAQ